MSNDILSEKICQTVLNNYFQAKNVKFISYDLKPISEFDEGFMGEHYNLKIKYETDGKILEELFFMKQKPRAESRRAIADETNCYTKEIILYNEIFKQYEKNGYDVSFSATSFYCIPDEAIIMENLTVRDFTLLERNAFFDLNQMKCVLKSLALFHGAAFAYEKTKSKELGKKYKFTDDYGEILKELLFIQYLESTEMAKSFWNGCTETLLRLIEFLPISEENKKEFLKLSKSYDIGKIFVEETNLPKTLGHGDLWCNNMMFKFEENIVSKACLFDYQLARYFYPCFDVIVAIFSNTSAEFRKKHIKDLYEYYYNTLKDILNNYGYSIDEIITKEEFYKELKLVKVDALLQVMFINTIICTPKEFLQDSLKDDKDFENVMFNSTDRSIQAYKTNDKFRTILTNIFLDIYEALIEAKNYTNI